MKVCQIAIRNFKSFGDNPVPIPLGDLTAFVGANNSGKSNSLKALDLFFNYSNSKVSEDCFHNGDLSKDIEITIEFDWLQDEEKRKFRRHLSPDGRLRITQHISAQPSASEEKGDATEPSLEFRTEEKRGLRVVAVEQVIDWLDMPHTPSQEQIDTWWMGDLGVGEIDLKGYFDDARSPTPEKFRAVVEHFWEENFEDIPQIEWLNISKLPSKTSIRSWWAEDMMVDNIDFKNMFNDPTQEPTPKDFFAAVEQFWEAHSDSITTMSYEAPSKVLGWPSKLKGNLPHFVLVPAVRHLQEELKIAKTNPYGMILSWLLGDIDEQRKMRLQEEIEQTIATALEQEGRRERRELVQRKLNDYVGKRFGMQLEFSYQPPDLDEVLRGSTQVFGDDGYRSLLDEKGQGVQRAVIFGIIRTYCDLRNELEGVTRARRNTIFAIEEPEICLHPAARRTTYGLLRGLSARGDQVVYTTHDGYFVDVQYFDEVRVFRRIKLSDGEWCTTVGHFPTENLIQDVKNWYGKDLTAETLRQTFRRFYDPARNEGFFAKKIILVEGQTEEYALPTYFRVLGLDIDSEEIAVISAGSAEHLEDFYIIFNELGIPCYTIFDGDKPQDEDVLNSPSKDQKRDLRSKSKRNRNLFKRFSHPDLVSEKTFFFPATNAYEHFAVFENKFEIQVHRQLSHYDQMKGEASRLYGTDSKPLIARHIALRVAAEMPESIPQILRDIVQRVVACEHRGTCLALDQE